MRFRCGTGTLPGRKPLILARPASLVELRVELLVELGGVDHDLEFALEAGAQCFGNLHVSALSFRFDLESAASARLVRAEGLEPPRVSPQEPKSCVSANFTTPARHALGPLQWARSIAEGFGRCQWRKKLEVRSGFSGNFCPGKFAKHVPRETIPRAGNGRYSGLLAASVLDQKHAKSGALGYKTDAKLDH